MYATAHTHDVNCRDDIVDGKTFVDIDAGFEVAPGDASDMEVANSHPWGCDALVFSDGAVAATALADNPSYKGMSCCFLNCIPATKFHMKSGKKKSTWNRLQLDDARVAAMFDNNDVLLRRRA